MGVSDAAVQSDVEPPNDFAGWSRSRTCNQTVMSGGISIGFVDFAVFSENFVRVRCLSIRLFLVRNWCGPWPTVETLDTRACSSHGLH
jgi:hypothetical protein